MEYNRPVSCLYEDVVSLNTMAQRLEDAKGPLQYILKKVKELEYLNQLFQKWCTQKKWALSRIINIRDQEIIIEVPHSSATYIFSSQQEILNFFQEEYSKDILSVRIKVQFSHINLKTAVFSEKRNLSPKAKMLLENTAKHLNLNSNPHLKSLKKVLENIASRAHSSSL